MSLEKIVAKILDDARAEAERIAAEGGRRAEAIRDEAEQQAEQQAGLLLRDAEREAHLEAVRIVTQARLERKIELLAARKALVAEVLERAFAEASLENRRLTRTVISRDGVKEETLDRARLMEELAPAMENLIVDILKI
ncbi:MAG: V-type ATP synthase subunit E family protein [Candidatus Aminicenantales bacterium]